MAEVPQSLSSGSKSSCLPAVCRDRTAAHLKFTPPLPPKPLTPLFLVMVERQAAMKQAVCSGAGNEGCVHACGLAETLESESHFLPFPQVLQKVSVLAKDCLQRIAVPLGDLHASMY